ncbi:MAG: hypothetical protein VR65_22445 [Desulfobulbaceae bacterium BRH_c16a]|nr:MAG: hypothetical protein VR65_22445 [Desulfobulbaceae bacterium BRH_c16a]
MNGFIDAIVIFLFLPVTLFIILPLMMLCGWLLWKAVTPSGIKAIDSDRNFQMKDEAILPKGS